MGVNADNQKDILKRKDTISELTKAFTQKEKPHTFPRNNLFYLLETCNKRFGGEFVRWEYDEEDPNKIRVYEKSGSFLVLKLDDIENQ